MGHDHQHHLHHVPASARAAARHRSALRTSFLLVVAFLVAQVVAGWLTGSLALWSDAGHMATDAVGLGLALAAIRLASSGDRRSSRTFGLYRLEILAAGLNSVLLFGVAAVVLVEAVRRLGEPTEVPPAPVLVVGLVGLAVNVACWRLLRAGAEESLNVRGAYLEVVADLLGSIGVVVGAAVMWVTGWDRVDALVGATIGVFILPRAWRLGRETVRVLLQAAPADVDLGAIEAGLGDIEDVVGVHDLHLWTLTSEMEVLTAHLMIRSGADAHGVLDQARQLLAERHGIHHATLQVEPDSHRGCEELTW